LPSDELEQSEDEPHSNPRQTRKSFIRSASSGKMRHRRQAIGLDSTYSSSDGSAPEDNAYTPSKKKVKKNPVKNIPIVISDSEDEPAMSLPTRSSRLSIKKQQSIPSSDDGSEDEIVKPILTSSQQRTSFPRNAKNYQGSPSLASNTRMRSKKTAIQNDLESEEDVRSSPRRRLARVAASDEDEEDEIVRPSPRKRRSQPTIESEDESQPVISPLKRTRKVVESDDSDIVSSPFKRRRNSQREVELSSDSDLPSPRTMATNMKRDSTSKTPPRFTRQQKTTRRHRTEKEKKMELLKRRRAGESIEQVTDSSDSASDEENEDEELQELSEFEDEEPSPENVRPSAKRKTRNRNPDRDGETDDFITEDEDGPLGVPDLLAQIPLEFTAAAHKPIKEHFRDVIEWLVHNKINPGFDWQDPVYETAFRKVDHECGGFADSKFVSTQWTAEFTKAIYARPLLEIRELNPGEGISVLGEAKCEVCNHRKHHPSYAIQLKGKAYNKVTLEDIEPDSDEDSESNSSDSSTSSKSSNSDQVSRDEKGQTLLSVDKIWFAGR
jgi:Domain of unknown function (DUF4211)